VAKLAGIPRSVVDRAKEILFNLEKKELDAAGLPRIAYHSSQKGNRDQLLLFQADRKQQFLEELRQEIENVDITQLTPLDALNWLNALKEKLKLES
jgi:DNA mismatch repair protein MutS